MPKRSKQQRLDQRGENHLRLQLERYVVNTYENDFGLDFEVNLTHEEKDDEYQEVTGDHFFIQLKSSETLDDEESVHTDLSTAHLSQYLNQPIPVVLAIYDDNTEDIYWCVIQEFVWDTLADDNPNWRSQGTVRVRIPRTKMVSQHERLESAIRRTHNRIIRRTSRDLNIGEGISFTADDFRELQEQVKNERLSFRGHRLLEARQHLKRGNLEEAQESIDEVASAEHEDEAKVKALLMKINGLNPGKADQAMRIIEMAHEARAIADDHELETDSAIARVHKHTAGLFILLSKREEMLVTDTVQDAVDIDVPDYDIHRELHSKELLVGELRADEAINEVLAALLADRQYYPYAICLSPIINYLASRKSVAAMSPRDDISRSDDIHPLVDQAVQLADFIPDPETEFNLRKSAGVYHYYNQNPDTATEFLEQARTLAEEFDDEFLNDDVTTLLERVESRPDPYASYTEESADSHDIEEATRMALEMQGFQVDFDEDEDLDATNRAVRRGIEDADPEEYYRHCEHLHLGYNPSRLGRTTGVVSIGTKSLWCKHGGGVQGVSLANIFETFERNSCEGCEHHCPRPDDWEFTSEFAEQQVTDPGFEEFLDNIRGVPYEGVIGTDE